MGKQSEFGRILYLDLSGDVSQATVFDFTDRITKLAENDITRSIHAMGVIGGDNWVFAGSTNAMPNITDISLSFTDWTADGGKKYGYIASTADSAHCQSEETEAITFGTNFSNKFTGNYTVKTYVRDEVWFFAPITLKSPQLKFSMGDLDDADYARDLDLFKLSNPEGYPVQKEDWSGGLNKTARILEIKGEAWIDKFGIAASEEFESQQNTGNFAINMLALAGLFNTVFVFWMWFKFVSDDLSNPTVFWWSWFIALLSNGCLWFPIMFIWPVVFFGGSTVLNIIAFFGSLTYFGAYLSYWGCLGFMFYTFYIEPAKSDSKFATTSDATPYYITYASINVFSALITLFFQPEV